MTPPLRGVRSVEIELGDVPRAAEFFTQVWNLTPIEQGQIPQTNGARYFRGTGAYHHILALHQSNGCPAVRRIVFDAATKEAVHAVYERVKLACKESEAPHPLQSPGGGYGFGFADAEGRNFAVVCDVADYADADDRADRPRKIAHVNLNATDRDGTRDFLVDVLGFKLIDETPALMFFHGDSTDHNALVVSRASRSTVNHVAFELPDLDSVMRGAGRMRDAGYPIEWGIGRHGAGNNVFAYFAGPEEFPLEYTGEVLQIDDSYVPRGPDHWRFPPGRMDQWGITPPHTARWKRIQNIHLFKPGAFRI
jgi:catechol 2,3-dioxygenase-like lactoylglutathione lyase family enzyme